MSRSQRGIISRILVVEFVLYPCGIGGAIRSVSFRRIFTKESPRMQEARMHMNYSYLYLDAAQELVFSIKTEDLHEQDFGSL